METSARPLMRAAQGSFPNPGPGEIPRAVYVIQPTTRSVSQATTIPTETSVGIA